MLLIVREAAANDLELRALLDETNAQRLTRMRHNAQVLPRRGFLREGVSAESAADVMWTLTAREV